MIEIRKAYPTDAYALINIKNSAWRNEFYDILPSEVISNKNIDERVKHLQDQIQENNRVIVATDDDKIIGFIFYAKTQGDEYENAEIREIYVLPEYQKKGIGKKLFEEAKEALKKLRFTSFIVVCPLQNSNIGFFTHLGGSIKGNKTEKVEGYSIACNVIYYEINNSTNEKQEDWNELYLKAQDQIYLLNDLNKEVAVLLSEKGNMYIGLGIKNKVCPVESALTNMYLGGENKITKILILNKQSNPVLPCGKCRDLLISLGQEQASILFDFGSLKTMTMKELNPYYKDEENK